MRDILEHVTQWYRSGERFALATVVNTFRSAPRQPGAAMAVSADGEAVGSISGGCVEAAVYELARDVIATGHAAVQRYGVTDDDAFAVGLTCGGIIDVLLQPVDATSFPEFEAVARAVEHGQPVTTAAVTTAGEHLGRQLLVWPDHVSGSLGDARLDAAVTEDAVAMLGRGVTAVRRYGPRGERRREDVAVFLQCFAPPARMLVFGAIDFAAAVARIGTFLGYQVTVCDARPIFATRKRFPDAHEVVVSWPHRYLASATVEETTAICVLTHDPKFDVPLLKEALKTPAHYIGVMGSRRTHVDRVERLREEGVTDGQIARLHSPIGLDLGASTPEETAVSIAAELIASRTSGSGRPLGGLSGPIHHRELSTYATPAP
jgi:xanthine dehydrogenase accessory factor